MVSNPGVPFGAPEGCHLPASPSLLEGVFVFARYKLGPLPSGAVGHGSLSLYSKENTTLLSVSCSSRVSPPFERFESRSNSPSMMASFSIPYLARKAWRLLTIILRAFAAMVLPFGKVKAVLL